MRVAIVTGGSRGLGRAVARELARHEWGVVVNARRSRELDEVARDLIERGGVVRALVGDVTDARHRDALVDTARALGELTLLVNNAGTLGPSPLPPLARVTIEQLRDLYDVNVVAPIALTQVALPLLRLHHATVLSVTSDAAVQAYAGWGGYGSTKAALDLLHRVFTLEEPGVRFCTFDPGDLRTEMHQAAYPGEDISDRPWPGSVAPLIRQLVEGDAPSGRYRASEWVR